MTEKDAISVLFLLFFAFMGGLISGFNTAEPDTPAEAWTIYLEQHELAERRLTEAQKEYDRATGKEDK